MIWGGLNSISCIEFQLSDNMLNVLKFVFLILVCREIDCSAATQGSNQIRGSRGKWFVSITLDGGDEH